MRSGSVSAAQLSDGAQHSFTCALVVLNERVRAEDSRNFCPVTTRVTVGLENDTETLARIKLLAERSGIPLAQLLGARHAKMIEATAVDEKA